MHVSIWRGQLCTFELEGVTFRSHFCGPAELWSSLGEDGLLDGYMCLYDE